MSDGGWVAGILLSPPLFMAAAFFSYGQLYLIREREIVAAIFLSPVLSAPVIALSIGVVETATGDMVPGSFEIVIGLVLLAGILLTRHESRYAIMRA